MDKGIEVGLTMPLGQFASDTAGAKRMATDMSNGIRTATARIDDATMKMAENMGMFAATADRSTKEAAKSFTTTYRDLQKMAATAIKMPRLEGGGLDLGATQMKAAALAAREQVNVFAMIGDAAASAAAREGGLTAATEEYIKMVSIAKVKAEAQAQKVEAQAAAVARLEMEMGRATGATATFNASQRGGAVSAGQQRAAMQQLSFQIGDVAQSFSLGMNPMMIFAQQGGQVVQAVGMMQKEAKGFIGFLGGPWGAAIMGAVTIVGMLGSKLLGTAEATSTAKLAANGLGDAQSTLGAMFDLTTGKLKSQNEMLLLNARLMSLNLRSEAMKAKEDSASAFATAGTGGWFTGGGTRVHGPAQRRLVDALQAGKMTPEEAAIAASKLNYGGLQLDQKGLLEAIANKATADAKSKMADLVDASLKNKVLDPALRTTPPKPKVDHHAETLASERAATEATTQALLNLADAYGISDAAALKAEARANAVGQAIKKQGDIEAFVARELQKLVAQRTVDAAKSVSDMRAQTAAQAGVNGLVADGVIPASQAASVMRDELALRPYLAAAAVAEGAAKKTLTDKIEEMRKAQANLNAEQSRSRALSANAAAKDDIAMMQEELRLIGATNAERAVALAQKRAEQDLRDMTGLSPEEAAQYVKGQVDRAAAQAKLTTMQDNYNASLSYTLDLLRENDALAQNVGRTLSDAFGQAGSAVAGMLTTFTAYAAREQEIADWKRDQMKTAGGDATRLAQIEKLSAQRTASSHIEATASMISSAKGLFKEHSAGYKAMAAAEKAFALVQLANTAVNVAAGAAKMFASLGPFAFPAVAAMIGVMASLGHKSGGSAGAYKAEDVQKLQGAGTVLGDSSAKSSSITNALDLLAKNSDTNLEYSNQMVRYLRAIESGIGSLTGAIARQLGVSGGAFDSSGLGLGSKTGVSTLGKILMPFNGLLSKIPIIGGLVGGIAKALFGSKTTRTLVDQGIKFYSDTLGDIMIGGLQGATYQMVEVTKKKKAFGITTSTKKWNEEYASALDNAVSHQATLILTNIYGSVVDAAEAIGFTGIGDMLKTFNVDIGKISLQGLKGDEIQKAITEAFSKAADQMTAYAVPGIDAFQKVGEGLFETLTRLAKDYRTIDVQLSSIGLTFGAVGTSSVAAREALIDLFGSLDTFVDQTQFYRSNFLTDAQQIAPVVQAVSAELARLNLSGVDTIDKFKSVVDGIDLTTAAGQSLYAAMMALAPGFKAVEDYQKKQAEALASTLKDTASKFQTFADDLRSYRASLFASEAGGAQSQRAALARLMQTGALAGTGDASAIGALKDRGNDYLTLARQNAKTMVDYQRAVALVAGYVDGAVSVSDNAVTLAQAQLTALETSGAVLVEINDNIVAVGIQVASVISAAANGTTAATASGTNLGNAGDLITEVQNLRTAIEAMKVDTGKLARIATAQDRGGAIAVVTDADSPLATEVV